MTTCNLTNPAGLLANVVFEYAFPKGDAVAPRNLELRPTDEALALAAQGGDLNAFDEIVFRFQEKVWTRLYRFCRHRAELEDLVQTVFITAFRKLDLWRPEGTFSSWLMRLAFNLGCDHYRKKKREPVGMAQELAADEEWEAWEIFDTLIDYETEHPDAGLIESLLLKLNDEDRQLMTMQYYDEYSLPEIAERFGWSRSKAKVKSFRARKKLAEILKRGGISRAGGAELC